MIDNKKIAVFISGRGSNLKSIYNAIKNGSLDAEIAIVVSSKEKALGLKFAQDKGIPTVVWKRNKFQDVLEYERYLLETLKKRQVGMVVLAGFLKKIPLKVIEHYYMKIVNIHPSLLPAFGGKGFYGLKVHESVIRSGSWFSGLTIHLVDLDYDKGPVVFQRIVEVDGQDNAETLANKILVYEHEDYPLVINRLVNENYHIKNNRVFFSK